MKTTTNFNLASAFCLLSLLPFGETCNTYAQSVGISPLGAMPDISALLDIDATGMTPQKGLLIPRVALTSGTDVTTIALPQTSLLVFNNGTGGLAPAGYYYNQGTTIAANWIPFLTNNANSSAAWTITGNAGTIASSAANTSPVNNNFIGTTDANHFTFATNNLERMRISSAGNVGIGTITPAFPLHVIGNSTLTSSSFINTYIGGSQTTANSSGYYGLYSSPAYTAGAGNTLTNLIGAQIVPGNFNAGAISFMYGLASIPQNFSTGTLSTVFNIFSRADNTSTGILGNVYGLYIASPLNTGGGTITAKYALVTEAAAGNVGIGTNLPSSKAILDVTSTTAGVLMPRMTTAQRLALATVEGLHVYDLTAHREMVWDGTRWMEIGSVPLGSIQAWDKSLAGTPAIPWGWVECNGQVLADAESPYNGLTMRALNSVTQDGSLTSGMFLRGSTTSGTKQIDATAKNGLSAATDAQIWNYSIGFVPTSTPNGVYNSPYGNCCVPPSASVNLSSTDTETRPANMTVVWIVKVK